MNAHNIILLLLLLKCSVAVFIDDYYPQEYEKGRKISIKANSMISNLHPNEPQDYYDLNFCEPNKKDVRAARRAENLGEILIGDKVLPTLYYVEMKVDRKQLQVCNKSYSEADISVFRRFVKDRYRVRWMLDSLLNLQPLNLKDDRGSHKMSLYEQGYDIGYLPDDLCDSEETGELHENCQHDETSVYVYSHVNIEVDVHGNRIVGFRTVPSYPILLKSEKDIVVWTYSVKWKETDQEWGSRWDVYGLNNTESKSVYMISTLLSMFFILLISIFLRQRLDKRILKSLNINRDQYQIRELQENVHIVTEELEDISLDTVTQDEERDKVPGWMRIAGQVYYPPCCPELLCALVASGIQTLIIIVFTAFLALLGIVYAAHRGLLLNCIMISFFITSSVNGYVSAWLYKSMALPKRDDISNFITSFFLFPILLLLIIFGVNIMLQHKHASSSIYWSTLGFIIFAWLCISFFTFSMGYYFGKSRPVKRLDRDKFYSNVPISSATEGPLRHMVRLGIGFLSFTTLWIPLKFIYMSIWGNMFYQLYALQWVSVLLWLFFTTELCLAFIFWQLNEENHRWWWESYATGISVTLPTILYSVVYYALNSDITSFSSLVIYFGYTAVFSLIIMLLSGSICFLASFFFVRRVCSLFKVD